MVNSGGRLGISPKVLVIEILCVTVVTVTLIRLLDVYINSQIDWIIAPCLLITAGLAPTFLRKKRLAEIGLCLGQPRMILRILGATCVILFPLLLGGIFLLRRFNIELPLGPIIPQERWVSWVAYQLMYVAVAEEIFFRGYFQSNVLRLLTMTIRKKHAILEKNCVMISATVFAISHCLILGKIMPIITFFPGLVFGWLLVRTKSLLAPILFHGLANIFYGSIATVLN
ncbi:MAG: CPBP family intramembrane metalloprotease [Sedimentisphaerales bacterium]|nr:CPBP family intramembrane metalloprotease [Sedimentisphaerales bacterium]